MTVKELSREQLTELKQNWYCEMQAQEGAGVSYGELSEIDELVSDERMYECYADTAFVSEDFIGCYEK